MSEGHRYVIAGGSGMVGQDLARSLEGDGHDVVVLTRSPDGYDGPGRAVGWSLDADDVTWQAELDGAAAVVNFAGYSVACRWTAANRRRIVESRVQSVERIALAVTRCSTPPEAWLQASAVGIYGDRSDTGLDETAKAGDGFLVDVCRQWESAFDAAEVDTRKVVLRIGVVLGHGGGAFPELRKLTKLFVGGRVGSGRQFMPWIHQDDFSAAMRFLLDDRELAGIVNLTAPQPTTNADVMAKLRKQLGRPIAPPAPAWVLNLGAKLAGLPAEAMLNSQRAVPRCLLDAGFAFGFADIESALADLTQTPRTRSA